MSLSSTESQITHGGGPTPKKSIKGSKNQEKPLETLHEGGGLGETRKKNTNGQEFKKK